MATSQIELSPEVRATLKSYWREAQQRRRAGKPKLKVGRKRKIAQDASVASQTLPKDTKVRPSPTASKGLPWLTGADALKLFDR